MAGCRRRREQKQRAKQRLAEASLRSVDPNPNRTFESSNNGSTDVVRTIFERLPPDLHAEIHRRLDFLRRLAFASICRASGHMLTPEAPWLIFPGETPEHATVLSLADGGASATATVRVSGPAMRGHVVIGSSGGWLVTADVKGALRMANPATGAHADLPAITTIPFLKAHGAGERWFCLHVEPFAQKRFGGPPPPEDKDWGPRPPRTSTLTAAQMRQKFYRKVVLSASPTPGSYAAMLITDRHIGSPAFATAADPSWRIAPSRDGVEDAIHHGGRFYSITYSGVVEAWRRNRDTGEFTSTVVAPRLEYSDDHLRRKYLAAAPDGRLMAVLKHAHRVDTGPSYMRNKATLVFFRVRVLDPEQRRWEAAEDIGDAALFVGVNASVCVSAAEHGGGGIKPGCVYFTDDEIGEACMRHEQGRTNNDKHLAYGETNETELRETGMYSFKTGNVVSVHAPQQQQQQNNHEADENDEEDYEEDYDVYPAPVEVEEEPRQHYGSWPPAAWFTPSFL